MKKMGSSLFADKVIISATPGLCPAVLAMHIDHSENINESERKRERVVYKANLQTIRTITLWRSTCRVVIGFMHESLMCSSFFRNRQAYPNFTNSWDRDLKLIRPTFFLCFFKIRIDIYAYRIDHYSKTYNYLLIKVITIWLHGTNMYI